MSPLETKAGGRQRSRRVGGRCHGLTWTDRRLPTGRPMRGFRRGCRAHMSRLSPPMAKCIARRTPRFDRHLTGLSAWPAEDDSENHSTSGSPIGGAGLRYMRWRGRDGRCARRRRLGGAVSTMPRTVSAAGNGRSNDPAPCEGRWELPASPPSRTGRWSTVRLTTWALSPSGGTFPQTPASLRREAGLCVASRPRGQPVARPAE